jgi:hypothetical protein
MAELLAGFCSSFAEATGVEFENKQVTVSSLACNEVFHKAVSK